MSSESELPPKKRAKVANGNGSSAAPQGANILDSSFASLPPNAGPTGPNGVYSRLLCSLAENQFWRGLATKSVGFLQPTLSIPGVPPMMAHASTAATGAPFMQPGYGVARVATAPKGDQNMNNSSLLLVDPTLQGFQKERLLQNLLSPQPPPGPTAASLFAAQQQRQVPGRDQGHVASAPFENSITPRPARMDPQDDATEGTQKSRKRRYASTQGEKWERMCDRLEEYKEKHGDCLVPFAYKHDRQLGWWVQLQRQNQSKLSEERLKQLDDLGFVWKVRSKEQWEDMFQRLEKFKEENGHCIVQQRYKADPKLGKWVHYQRSMQFQLSDERKNLLDTIGFVWNLQEEKARREAAAAAAAKKEQEVDTPVLHINGV